MRSVKAEQSQPRVAESQIGQPVPCFRESYLERLGIVYLDQIRLTIVTELYMRAMSVNQFYETIGGSSYDSVRRHFFRLVEFGWLQYVKTAPAGRGAPEKLYRSTELAVIDTETWRTLPFSIRDAFTVQLLEEMGGRIGEALKHGSAHAKPNAMSVFKLVDVDERAWHESYASIERCFHTILRKQSDAK
ncbi:MAG TPA: hypothetical protein VKC34_07035, partial [Blastocatellia bacterium]|nr:hypothetical protein [Blastocatellia bacterium]